MCGIVAIINNYNPVPENQNFLKYISHRGRDGLNYEENNKFFFGHSLFKSTDANLSSKFQPLKSLKSNNTIIFNGDIYNFRELRSKYLNNYKFVSNSDTEVLLYLYEKFGKNFLSYLVGDFSLIIHDYNSKKYLVARDRFGVKPLFYVKLKKQYFFSSEIKALKSFLNNKVNFFPNQEMAKCFLDYNYKPLAHQTYIKNIETLEPSSVMIISEDGNLIENYNYWFNNPESFYAFNKNNLDIYELIQDSVSLRSESIYDRYSLFLSGGFDSSTVLNYLSKNENKKITTYSFVEEKNTLENKNIQYFIEKFKGRNIKSILISQDDIDYHQELDSILKIIDCPLPDFSFIASFYFTRMSKENNDKIIFKGDGGDEIFCGYQKHIYAYLAFLLKDRKFQKYFESLSKFKNFNNKNIYFYLLASLYEYLPNYLKNFKNNLAFSQKNDFYVNPIKNINFYKNFSKDIFLNVYFNFIYNWMTPYVTDIEDKVTSYFNVLYRAPLTDHRLVESVLSENFKNIFDYGTKSILKTNTNIKFPNSIKKENEKRHFPGGLQSYINQNSSNMLEFMNDTIANIDFIDKKNF
ncbi:Asparagine synthase [alpha proteobacterium HIMB59]|nr:Asparagine synthase [alpha proteobacterium HIMB59]